MNLIFALVIAGVAALPCSALTLEGSVVQDGASGGCESAMYAGLIEDLEKVPCEVRYGVLEMIELPTLAKRQRFWRRFLLDKYLSQSEKYDAEKILRKHRVWHG